MSAGHIVEGALVLADGSVFEGELIGADHPVSSGEVVFNTALSGYQEIITCLLYTSPSPRDATLSRMPSSA